MNGKTRSATALLAACLSMLVLVGCGGSSSSDSTPTAPPQNGALYTVVSDTPACDVLNFSWFLNQLQLHPQGKASTKKVTAFPTNTSPISPVVDVSTLRGLTTLADIAGVPPGTYDQAILTVVVNSAAAYDPSQSPPTSILNPNITTTEVTVNIQPALVITSGKISMLRLDFNLLKSIEVDQNGQMTNNVTPVFTANPILPDTNGFGPIDDVYGFVQSINTVSPGTNAAGVQFTGALQIETLSGRGPSVSVDFTKDTKLVGATALDQVTTGSFAEIEGYIDNSGNLVATGVQIEDRANLAAKQLAIVGPVLTVTRDSSGNVTQFAIMVRDTEPNDSTDLPVGSGALVSFTSSTGFQSYALDDDLTALASAGNLTFSANTLQPGQDVVVHGPFTTASGVTTTIAANNVYQRFQPVQGSFSSVLSDGSDDKTGGFQLSPCSNLQKGLPYVVITDANTDFVNLSGLSALTPSQPLIVNGLLLFDAKGSSLNGVTIPAGSMVVLARRVQPVS